MKILIVEDEEMISRLLLRWCNVLGIEAQYAENGERALEILAAFTAKKNSFDAILSDVDMPKLNGIKMYNTIKQLYPQLSGKVFFFTSNTFDLVDIPPERIYTKPSVDVEFMLSDIRLKIKTGDV